MAGKRRKRKHPFLKIFFTLQLLVLLVCTGAVLYYNLGGYAKEVKALREEAEYLVEASTRDTFRSGQTSVVYAADGSVISKLKSDKDSYYVTIDRIPQQAVAAIVSIEDKKFFRHDGVDYRALLRAVKAMIENGEITQGGSTITMQLARNIFLNHERSFERKVEEIFIAWELEDEYSKDEIIEFYLNNIYFGNGYYGIQAASRGYFNRNVWELGLSELAFLCGIPNNPTLYDPLTNMENAMGRRDRILKNMLNDGKISELDYAEAIIDEVLLERPETTVKHDYVETYTYYCAARALMEQRGFVFQYDFSTEEEKNAYDEAYSELYASCMEELYTGGYQIETSFDLELQEELQNAVNEQLADYTEVNEEGVYKLQASAACIDNETGFVCAIVGGREQEFAGYTLNRAYQSYRQPGSAIKPLIVYTPILERGYTADTIVVDQPLEDGPSNASGTYEGEVTLRHAVEQSINTVAWQLFQELTPTTGLAYLKNMNFTHIDAEDYRPSTALGGFTYGASAVEMTSAYAAIENDGIYRNPTCIVRISDNDGNVIYEPNMDGTQVYRTNAARSMTDILTGVMTIGTGKKLNLDGIPCAGKTGTTNDNKDGWFVGFTRYYTTGVWVGYDMPQKLEGLKGASYPGRIWQNFMQEAHEELPVLEFFSEIRINGDYSSPYFEDDDMTDEEETSDSVIGDEEAGENPDGNATSNEAVEPINPVDIAE